MLSINRNYFYFISCSIKSNAVVFSDDQRLSAGDNKEKNERLRRASEPFAPGGAIRESPTKPGYNLIREPISKTLSEGRLKYLVTRVELRPKKSNKASRKGLMPVYLVISIDSLPRK